MTQQVNHEATLELFRNQSPFIYPGIPAEEYHRLPLCSHSGLEQFRKSPAHFRAWLESEDRSTAAQSLGTAIHLAVLEPELFDARYAMMPPGLTRQTKAGKAAYAELLSAGKTVLSAVDMNTTRHVAQSLREHPTASVLVAASERTELSIVQPDPITHVLSKVRLDLISEELGIIPDLKSTVDASPEAFSRDIFKLGYHRKAAFYLDIAKAAGLKVSAFVIIAIEKEPPYAVAVYRLQNDAVEQGRRELLPLRTRYALCLEKDEWDCYPTEIVNIGLPRYGQTYNGGTNGHR